MGEKSNAFESLVRLIDEKGTLKQKVYQNTLSGFKQFVEVIEETLDEIKKALPNLDDSVPVEYKIKNEFEIQVTIAGDILIFHMHTNIFQFERNHRVWKTSYVQEDETRSYCGIIYVYNFLKDSFKYDRNQDLGYLIGRVFINKDNHYFVEGKRQMGFLYNNFSKAVLSKQEFRKILESVLLYSLDFDLFIPLYDEIKEITVYELKQVHKNAPIRTGKRLGYKFQTDSEDVT